VIDASLFDASGRQISNQNLVPAALILAHYSSSSPQLFMRELRSNQMLLGYLRVTLDREFLLKQNASISENKWHLVALLSLVSMVIGLSIGVRFTRWRMRH
jgi:uncharacterized membrane protein affecting hemolysin expression